MKVHHEKGLYCFIIFGTICYQFLIKSTSAKASCRQGWQMMPSSKSCMMLHIKPETWEDAKEKCVSDESHLAQVMNEKETQEFADLRGTRPFWIGLSLFNTTDEKWLNSEDPVAYKNWMAGEPDHPGMACAVLEPGGEWADEQCNLLLPYVCQKSPECLNKTYGIDCIKYCSIHCGGFTKSCDKKTGKCLEGCDAGFTGPLCTSTDDTTRGVTIIRDGGYYWALIILSIIFIVFIAVVFGVMRLNDTSTTEEPEDSAHSATSSSSKLDLDLDLDGISSDEDVKKVDSYADSGDEDGVEDEDDDSRSSDSV